MYCILVVSQYVFQHCDAIIEWMIVVWMIVVWMNAEWIRIHRGGQTATVGRMGCMGIINSWRTLSSLLSSLLSFLLSSLFSSLFSESESGRSFQGRQARGVKSWGGVPRKRTSGFSSRNTCIHMFLEILFDFSALYKYLFLSKEILFLSSYWFQLR